MTGLKEKSRRRLAAIMFADMAGYTAMMQEDELLAIAKRRRHREILTQVTSRHHGEILQFYGDGTLSIFESCADAVVCAIEIQNACKDDPQIPLRIGIHSGDVVLSQEGVFGDGVNIASRIESISVPGAILISDKVYDDLKNQKHIQAVKLGNFTLKHVIQDLDVYAIANEGIYIPDRSEISGKARLSERSIIVLPFLNLTSDSNNEFFSDGITEEILNALTKVEGLRVTSRTSSFSYKGKVVDVKKLARELNIDTVLEGSVRMSGKRVRITAQLIHAEDDFHFWAESFDRQLDDIFEVQDEIALKIANKMRAQFDRESARQTLLDKKPRNLEAYQAYLKGRHSWNKFTPQDAFEAIEHYQRASNLEKSYFLPYIGIMEANCYLGIRGYIHSAIALRQAREAMNKAYQIDANHFKTFLGIASYKFFLEWDWKGSERYFQEAMSGNPDDAGLLYVYALFLLSQKRFDQAISLFSRAIENDPLNLPIRLMMVDAYYYQQDYISATRILDELILMAPELRSATEAQAWVYFMSGKQRKALEYFKKYQEMTDNPLKGLYGLGYAYARTFQIDEAYQCLEKLFEREKTETDVILHMDFAYIYLGLKEYEKMFDRLELAMGEKLGGMIFLDVNPIWDEIRRFPKYNSLVKRLGKE